MPLNDFSYGYDGYPNPIGLGTTPAAGTTTTGTTGTGTTDPAAGTGTGAGTTTPAAPAAGTGYLIHFPKGNPSNIHGVEPPVTGDEGNPYDEPLSVSALVQQPKTCYENCQDADKAARVHCDIIRKRVAQWMKDTGCASSVRGFKQKTKCGKKKAAKKTTTTKATATRSGKPK